MPGHLFHTVYKYIEILKRILIFWNKKIYHFINNHFDLSKYLRDYIAYRDFLLISDYMCIEIKFWIKFSKKNIQRFRSSSHHCASCRSAAVCTVTCVRACVRTSARPGVWVMFLLRGKIGTRVWSRVDSPR